MSEFRRAWSLDPGDRIVVNGRHTIVLDVDVIGSTMILSTPSGEVRCPRRTLIETSP